MKRDVWFLVVLASCLDFFTVSVWAETHFDYDQLNHDRQLEFIGKDIRLEFSGDISAPERLQWSVDENAPVIIHCNNGECGSGAATDGVNAYRDYRKRYRFHQGFFLWLMQDYTVKLNMIARL